MTYELAKKLKDAGFPQKGFWFYGSNETDIPCLTYQANPFDTCNITFKKTKSDDEVVMLPYSEKVVLCYAPTLSELIEACGDSFFQVGRHLDYWVAISKETYQSLMDRIIGEGQTPEIAVANLWLKLNEKEKLL